MRKSVKRGQEVNYKKSIPWISCLGLSSFREYCGTFTGNTHEHWSLLCYCWTKQIQKVKFFQFPVLPLSTYDHTCHFLLVRDSYPCSRWSGRNHREKIGVHVVFDQVLTMEPYCCRDMLSSLDKETFAYDLSAVVMHHGKGFGSGHYTAYCYNTEGGACATLWGGGHGKGLVCPHFIPFFLFHLYRDISYIKIQWKEWWKMDSNFGYITK